MAIVKVLLGWNLRPVIACFTCTGVEKFTVPVDTQLSKKYFFPSAIILPFCFNGGL